MAASWSQVHVLEALAAKQTVIHRLHPLAKLLTVVAFLITVASFGRYAFSTLLPMLAFPIVVVILGDLPVGALLRRTLISAPFAVGLGIFNPVLDHSPLIVIGKTVITGGWISFGSIILRTGLMVVTALTLIATSGIEQIGGVLRQLRIPRIFVVQLLLLYRYLSVLGEEMARTTLAYSLRAPRDRGVRYAAWGSLLGQLLLRSIDRAGRIYQAMLCRGFQGEIRATGQSRFSFGDAVYILVWLGYFAAARCFDLPKLIGGAVVGVHP